MTATEQGAMLASLFLTGLAGSLHCVGMCGPLLIGFSRALGASTGGRDGWSFLYYHAGRLWTYALLGLLVGWASAEMRLGAIDLGWQRPLAIGVSVLVIGFGATALGLIPGLRLDLSSPGACNQPSRRWPWLATLIHEPRPSARLLLGAVMGLLPCGLVYAALLVAASLPNPLICSLGMLCFGMGTLPALSAVVLGGRLLPPQFRGKGARLAAAMLIGIGLFMLARSLWMPLAVHHH